MPTGQDVYVDPQLTDISIKYKNDTFVADTLFPVLNVAKKTGFYFVYDKQNLRAHNSERSGVARANRVDYSLIKTPYGPLVEHSLEVPIEYDVLSMYEDPLDPRTDATETVTEMILIEKEVKIATLLGDTTQVTQNQTNAGTSQWNDYGNSNPFQDIWAAINVIKKFGIKPANTLVFGQDVWIQIVNHPDFLDRIKYSELGKVTSENIKMLFPGIENVVIASAVQNTAVQGQTDSLAYIWGKNCQVMYVTPSPAIRQVTAGYTLTLDGGRKVENWDEMQVKAEFVRATDYYQQKLVAPEAVYLIKAAVA